MYLPQTPRLGYSHDFAGALAAVARLWERCLVNPKAVGLIDSWSGHVPGLRVWSLVTVEIGSNQLIFISEVNVSLSLSLFLSLKAISKSLGQH